MAGHRGFYRDGWEVVTLHQPLTPFGDHEWELYDLADDPTELRDLAAEHPERVAELAAAWEAAARAEPGVPARRGLAGCRYVRAARRTTTPFEEPVTHRRRHAHARALPVAAADPVAVVRRRRRAVVPHAATRACSSPTATRAAATRSYVDDGASWSSCTTATAR